MSNEDKAKSLILSLTYEVDGEYQGKTIDELKGISAEIRTGRIYEFSELEVRNVISYAETVTRLPARRLLLDGAKWLAPPILLLAGLYVVLHIH